MQKITTAYVMYYNKKYKHTGGLQVLLIIVALIEYKLKF